MIGVAKPLPLPDDYEDETESAPDTARSDVGRGELEILEANLAQQEGKLSTVSALEFVS